MSLSGMIMKSIGVYNNGIEFITYFNNIMFSDNIQIKIFLIKLVFISEFQENGM